MTRVLVTGGTGVLGRRLVSRLSDKGYTVRVMSRHDPPAELTKGLEWAQADLENGEGLRAAVGEVHTIVHAASSPLKRTHEVDVEGTRRLLEYAHDAAVSHFIYVSIVGMEAAPSYPYYRHKLAAEAIVTQGNVHWSILRATQFHDLLDYGLRLLTKFPIALLPTDLQFQPIDAGEVADALCAAVEAGPAGRLTDMGGPEVLRVKDLANSWLRARNQRRIILPLRLPGRTAHGFRSGYLTCPQQRQGRVTWAEWVQRRYAASRSEKNLVSPYAGRIQT